MGVVEQLQGGDSNHITDHEQKRLQALYQCQVLDTPPESNFDQLTWLAAEICKTSMAGICLLDRGRQWFKSSFGVELCEEPREQSFCEISNRQQQIFQVEDARADAHWSRNPWVAGGPAIRFYAGAPLVTPDGYALGTLCVMDRRPHLLSPSQQEALRVLGQQVVAQLELRRQRNERLESELLLRIVTENARVGLVIVNQARRYAYANQTYSEILGLSAPALIGKRVADVLPEVYEAQIGPHLDLAFSGERVSYELQKPGPDGDRYYAVRYEPVQGSSVVVVLTDISESRRTQLSLRASHDLLVNVIDSSPSCIFATDRNHRYILANQCYARFVGRAVQDVLGHTQHDLFPEDVATSLVNWNEAIMTSGESRNLDQKLLGSVVRTVKFPLRDSRGNVVGLCGVATDLTAAQLAEDAQQASEARYRTLFECAPDGIVIADQNSRCISVNPSLCRMLGCTTEDLLDRPTSEFAVQTDSAAGREWQFRRRDGSFFPAEVLNARMPDGNLLTMVRDLSERDRANQALRTAEERMRFALENSGVGIWDMDYDTGRLHWSETLEAQYGLPPGTFAGSLQAFLAQVHPEERDQVIQSVRGAMQTGTDFSVLHRVVWPNGNVRWLSGAGRIYLDDRGQPVLGVGISQDVTEQQNLQAQYLQSQKMEAVGQLAGGVAHDFNNLLTVILGFTELLLEQSEQSTESYLEEILKAGHSAAALTRQLLAFSRKQIVEPVVLDLNEVVTNMQGMLARLLGEDIEIRLALAAEEPILTADRGQLEQVILNLAVNARDAMPKGGRLTITTALEAHEVALTVTDTGGGILPEVQPHLFEPFFTTKEIGRGTGLGLATVHGIVTQSGGSIQLVSEVGAGACFLLRFPRSEGEHTRPAIVPSRSQVGGKHTVLVVDDATGLLEYVQKLLERHGYVVLAADSAGEAQRLFEENPAIEVLVTDVVMPGVSGPELSQRLCAQRPALRTIYMSGYSEDAIAERGVIHPGIQFLQKPFSSESLLSKLHEVCTDPQPGLLA